MAHHDTHPNGDLAHTENDRLIASDRVEGTSVYSPGGESLGSIENLMIGKTDGHVAYAVLSFGGFLGLGSRYYPIPWHQLRYDTGKGGYVTALTEQQLKGAPGYDSRDQDDWRRTRADWPTVVDSYYGAAGPDIAGTGVMADRARGV